MADNTSTIAGLFMSPEMYQQQRDTAALDRFATLGQMDPFARANTALMYGGYQAGNALAGALGAQDPMMQALSTRRQLAGQFDTSSAEGLIGLSQALRQAGDLQGAAQVAQQALLAREKEATIQAKLAERLTGEQKNAAALADSAGFTRGTSEWTKKYNEELAGLTAKAAQIEKVGVAEATREPVYFDKKTNEQFIIKKDPSSGLQIKIPFNGGIDQLTSKTNVNVDNKGRTAFEEEIAKLDAKDVQALRQQRADAIAASGSLNKLTELTNKDLISGQFATGRTGATNLLQTLGLVSPTDANRLANSQEYQKVAGDVILKTLGGRLGSGFSNADREFIASLVPQLETSPIARKKLIEFMQNKNQDVIKKTTEAESFARENQGFRNRSTGEVYYPPVPAITPTNPAAGMTTEQLKAIAGVK